MCAIVFWADTGNNRKTVNFAYSRLYARPIKVEKLLSNSLAPFNLENINLLSNLNINPKNGAAYKKTCGAPQMPMALKNVFILFILGRFIRNMYKHYLREKAKVLEASVF